MGRILIPIAVTNPADPGHEVTCDALVDTGAFEQAGLVVDVVGHRLVRLPRMDLKAGAASI